MLNERFNTVEMIINRPSQGTVQLREGSLTALIIDLADHHWDIVILPLIGGTAADFFWELDKSFILSEPATLINLCCVGKCFIKLVSFISADHETK